MEPRDGSQAPECILKLQSIHGADPPPCLVSFSLYLLTAAMVLSNEQPTGFLDGTHHLTRSLGGISELRKSLLMMAAFFLRKSTSFLVHTLRAANASAESASLENLQKHVFRCHSETSALICRLGRHGITESQSCLSWKGSLKAI